MRWVVLAGTGGAIGALGRWAIAEMLPRSTGAFPWATLIVNIVGCFAIGIAAGRLVPTSDEWRFAVTGVIGGFTTFSTFANETRELLGTRPGVALAYVASSLGIGLLAVNAGFRLGHDNSSVGTAGP